MILMGAWCSKELNLLVEVSGIGKGGTPDVAKLVGNLPRKKIKNSCIGIFFLLTGAF